MCLLLALVVVMFVYGFIYRLRVAVVPFKKNMKGKTVIITGASAGIGKEAARDLARRGARVILACRNLVKAARVADEIQISTGNCAVLVRQLDTSSLASVRSFAAKILAEESRLDVLVLNAGMAAFKERTVTSDGLELTMVTNHFGHFLLANLLLGLLKSSSPSRIVITASRSHCLARKIDPQVLNFENGDYLSIAAYTQSKACNILVTRHLADILSGTGVKVNSLCPGFVRTEIFEKSNNIAAKIQYYVAPILSKTVEQGAQTIVHLAVSEEAGTTTGQFFENCKVSNSLTSMVTDASLAKKVWEASESYVGLKPEEQHF